MNVKGLVDGTVAEDPGKAFEAFEDYPCVFNSRCNSPKEYSATFTRTAFFCKTHRQEKFQNPHGAAAMAGSEAIVASTGMNLVTFVRHVLTEPRINHLFPLLGDNSTACSRNPSSSVRSLLRAL